MPRIYQADVWCDDCGKALKDRLRAEGKAPEDALDEASYDSDDFPKYASEEDESDSPQHCAAGPDCLGATIISGERCGRFLHNPLTADGLAYVSEAALRPDAGPVARFWAGMYEDGLCGSGCWRLEDHACERCGRKVRRVDCDGHGNHDDAEDCAPAPPTSAE